MRSTILVLSAILAIACGNNGYATVPPPDAGLVWPISVQCVRTMDFGEEVVTTTTFGSDAKANWVPGCTQAYDGTWRCPAPPQTWWTKDGANGTIRCNLSPCQGVEPGKVMWFSYTNGYEIKAQQAPTTLPKKAPSSEPTPQGGGDSCLNRENAWVFAPHQ
jgi:hypothetical protein